MVLARMAQLGAAAALALTVGVSGTALAAVKETPGMPIVKASAKPLDNSHVRGPVHFHATGDKGSSTVVGVHAREIVASGAFSAAIYGGADCTGTQLGKAGPRQVHKNGRGVLKVNASVNRDQVKSAGILDASGKLVACSNEKDGSAKTPKHPSRADRGSTKP
ncbi:MAG: hypothetical protein IT307_05065 [Chloroflexi bacterium]|nr:hypothetical protein [Chloroflexota bacterium]